MKASDPLVQKPSLRIILILFTTAAIPITAAAFYLLYSNIEPQAVFPFTSKTVKLSSTDQISKIKFPFYNPGSRKLEIVSIDSSCGCTTANTSLSAIEPKSYSSIDLEINPIESGEKTIFVNVHTDSKKNNLTTLTVRLIGFKPAPFLVSKLIPLNFGSDLNTPQRFSIITQERRGSPEWINSVKSPNHHLSIKRTGVTRTKHSDEDDTLEYSYEASFSGMPETGDVSTSILAYTDDRDTQPLLTFPVFGEVKPLVYPNPGVIFRHISLNDLSSTKIPVLIKTSNASIPLEISAPDDCESYEVKKVSSSHNESLFIFIPKAFTGKSLITTIRFRTNIKGYENIEVPVKLLIDSI